jgi:hypothetical protein
MENSTTKVTILVHYPESDQYSDCIRFSAGSGIDKSDILDCFNNALEQTAENAEIDHLTRLDEAIAQIKSMGVKVTFIKIDCVIVKVLIPEI